MSTILEIIESRLIPDEQAKKARGEVFTPLNLVRELLYGLRKSDFDNGDMLPWGVDEDGNVAEDDEDDRIGGIPLEVWRDPDTKWLDPANGIGNFPFVAFHMLDYQLKHHGTKGSKEWSDADRRKHIIGNMLYMIEIDRGNVNTSVKIFRQLVPGLTANVYCSDALKADTGKIWGVEEFDVVMGNPPFQKAVTLSGYLRRAQHTDIWDKFVTSSISWLKSDGYLAFIIKQTWRKPENDFWSEIAQKNTLVYLRILAKDQPFFKGVSQRIDMFLMKKSNDEDALTDVVDEKNMYHQMNVHSLPFMPNYDYEDILKIVVPTPDRGIPVIYDSTMYRTEKPKTGPPKVLPKSNEEYKHPVVHSMTKNGMVYVYSNQTKGHFGEPKVLLNKNEQQYPYNDYEGEFGMSELTFGIPITSKEQGDQIVEAINSDRFREIIKATKWGAFQTEYKMFKYFRPDFYKEFLKKADEGGARHITPRKKKSTKTTRRACF
jgi:hypothetical protein